MRKLRICPVWRASALETPLAELLLGDAPPFQRACNIEVSEERSGFNSGFADDVPVSGCCSAGFCFDIEHAAWTPSPNSTRAFPPETSIMRPATISPCLCSALDCCRLLG